MSYKIIGDSCTDLTPDLKKDPHFQIIPLILQVGNTQIIDDETFSPFARHLCLLKKLKKRQGPSSRI